MKQQLHRGRRGPGGLPCLISALPVRPDQFHQPSLAPVTYRVTLPHWGTEYVEIKVPSAENPQLSKGPPSLSLSLMY